MGWGVAMNWGVDSEPVRHYCIPILRQHQGEDVKNGFNTDIQRLNLKHAAYVYLVNLHF